MADEVLQNQEESIPKEEPKKKGRPPKIQEATVDEAADYLQMSFQELINAAAEQGIDTYGKTRVDILTELGVTGKKGGKVFVRPVPSQEKLQLLVSQNRMVPMNTIFPEEEFDDWLKIVEKEPFAFNGADLTDKTADIIHTLRPKLKCACGATVEFPRHPDHGGYCDIVMCPGVPSTIVRRGRSIDVRSCITYARFRKYILHEVPKE